MLYQLYRKCTASLNNTSLTEMPNNKKNTAVASLQQTLLKANTNDNTKALQMMGSAEDTIIDPDARVTQLLEKLAANQMKIWQDQVKNFADIRNQLVETRRTVTAFEEKLPEVLTRVNRAEACLDTLKETER